MSSTTDVQAPSRSAVSPAPAHPKLWMLRRTGQVAAGVLREKVAPPEARTVADVPISGDAVTREWLTAVLCREHPGAEVVTFEIPGGSSGTSTRRAIRVTYNAAGVEAGLPTRLYAKTTTAFKQRLVLGMADVIHGETTFFNDFRPKVDIEAPLGHFAMVDPRSWRSMTLIEDVAATKGATFNSPHTPVSREQMEDLLANMAIWHGAFWNGAQFDGRVLLKTPAEFLASISQFISFRQRSKVGAKRAEAMIPEPLRARQDALWHAYEASMEISGRKPRSLLHGDSHIGNTYRTAAGGMGFADWQVVQQGCWGYDFAYIVTSGLTVEDRRSWERELLAFYLERLGEAGGAPPGFDEAWLTYRQHLFHPYFAWVFTIGRGPLQPKFQPDDVSLLIIERTSHAIDDLDALDAVGIS
jgi:hypothetical protein